MALGFDAISDVAISGEVGAAGPAGTAPFIPAAFDDGQAVRRRESGLRGDVGIVANVILGALVFLNAGQQRAVAASPVFQRHQIQVDAQPNLLTSTLATGAALAPFSPTDWPFPAKARAVQDTSGANVTANTLVIVPAVAPFQQNDWPVLTKARVAQDTNVPNVTANTLVIVPAVPPFQTNDWPVQTKARVAQDTNVPNFTAATLAAIGPPLRQTDWPILTKARVLQDTNVPNVTANTLPIVASVFPFSLDDWPVLTKARVVQDTNVPNVTANTLVIVPLTAQTRPPLITSVFQRHQIQVDIPANLLTTGPAQLPKSQKDWPVLPKARVVQDTNVPNILIFASLAVPFTQPDWPVITKARAVQDTNILNVAITSTVAAPFAQSDWPHDTKYRVIQDTNVPNILLLQPLTLPVNQTDWPVLTKARVVQDTNVYNLVIGTGLTIPFSLDDWPVLTKAHAAQDTNTAQGAIYATLAAPDVQSDWPVITKARVVQDTNVPNLLLATQLSAPVTPPDFAPAVRRKDGQLDTLPNLQTSTFALPPVQFPFSLDDWPVITRARVVQETNLYNLVIYQTLTAPAVPQDFGQVWRRKDGQLDTLPNLQASTFALPSTVFPFGLDDWPVITKARAVQDTNVLNLAIGATLTAPVAPQDFGQVWPRKPGALDLAPNATLTTLSLPSTVFPISFDDLGDPARKGRSAQQVDYFGNATALLPPAQLLPFANPELAVLFKRRDVQADAQSASVLLLSATPIDDDDIQIHAAKARAVQDTNVPNLLASTLSALSLPFGGEDFPVIVKARAAQDTSVVNLLASTLSALSIPFGGEDFPVVLKARAAQDTNVLNLVIFSTINKPVTPPDFAPAVRRKDGQFDVLPNATATTLKLPPVVKPFLQNEWPSPARGKYWPPEYWANLSTSTLRGTLTGGPRYIVVGSTRYFTISREASRDLSVARQLARAFEVSAITTRTFDIKDPAELVKLTFDFSPDLLPLIGVTLANSISVAVTDQLGSDPSPSNILNGAAALNASATKVIVPVKGGVDQSRYVIRVVAATTDPYTVLELTGVLPVSV